MIENLIVDYEVLFREIVERGQAEGVTNENAYRDLCEDVVQEHVDLGEIDKDTDTVEVVEHFIGRWPEFQEEVCS